MFTGLLLGTIISEMQAKRENTTKLLFHFYSSHDTTLTNILNLLNVYNSITPPLSSSILFELRERDGTHNIVVSFELKLKISVKVHTRVLKIITSTV